ncbi:transmembrane protein 231-like [Argopecten irradians]|uniref:transmembrane protein 231-like n=1 Tax=Argopecten irradians TaxID=31199 RepID=UPI003715FA34
MAVYEVFAHPELRRYKTHVCTKASILMFVVLFVTFIPPLFVVYRSYGFWIKEDYYRETPRVLFKKELILVVELEDPNNAGLSYLTYSTYQRYNELQQNNVRVPVVQSREDDSNGDGKNDGLAIKIEMPLLDTENVVGMKLLLFFDYRLERFSSFGMESLAYVSYDSVKAGARYDIYGELCIKQKQALDHKGLDTRFNQVATHHVILPIAGSHTPCDTEFWSILNLSFRYTPGFWYMVKWGWVQYVSVLLLFLFVFDRIKIFIFQNQLVTTIVEKPWKADKFS